MVTEPPAKYLAALAFILSGLVFYIPFVYYKYRPSLMGNRLQFLLRNEKKKPKTNQFLQKKSFSS